VYTREKLSHAEGMSFFESVKQAPEDSILGVAAAYKADPNPDKLDLGVGAYRTEEGTPYVLDVVKKASEAIFAETMSNKQNKEYLPIGGDVEFVALSAALAFGQAFYDANKARVSIPRCVPTSRMCVC
jgi:aspartate/tyrosine/aromatic aminotransferase